MQPLRRFARLGLLVSTLVAGAALPQAVFVEEAQAASEKKKVAVGAFEGDKKGDARSAFIEALKADGGYEVTDAEDVKHTAKDKQIADAAKGLAVNVVITGKVTKFNLKLKVRDGSNGKTLEQPEIKGGTLPKLKTNIEKTAVSSVDDPVAKAKGIEEKKEEPKPAEEEAPKEEAEEEKKDEEPEAPSTPGEAGELSPLDITAGLRPIHRSFEFHDTAYDKAPNQGFQQLLRYELPLGPALFIDLNLYPGSFFGSGPMEWIGLTGGYEKGFATESVFLEGQPDEKTLKTDIQHWFAGAHFRFPIGSHQLGLLGTYGQHSFILNGDEDNGLIPDIKYSYARVLAEANFSFGDFFAGGRVGKRFVLGVGPIGTFQLPQHHWFTGAKAQSLEFGVEAGYHLISMLDLVAGFDWLRYAYDFNASPYRPGYDSFQAGGAIDQYYTGYIAFRFRLPAKGKAEGGGAAVSAGTE